MSNLSLESRVKSIEVHIKQILDDIRVCSETLSRLKNLKRSNIAIQRHLEHKKESLKALGDRLEAEIRINSELYQSAHDLICSRIELNEEARKSKKAW